MLAVVWVLQFIPFHHSTLGMWQCMRGASFDLILLKDCVLASCCVVKQNLALSALVRGTLMLTGLCSDADRWLCLLWVDCAVAKWRRAAVRAVRIRSACDRATCQCARAEGNWPIPR
ncbi:hypothetical protein COO60DRAFT_762428 [Scenedesmus sp. NREL 46B-D3]|nr:hypothetical protein COO60DRAFT_762428 [Scenedesmus sp. NREL 46B-D3]